MTGFNTVVAGLVFLLVAIGGLAIVFSIFQLMRYYPTAAIIVILLIVLFVTLDRL